MTPSKTSEMRQVATRVSAETWELLQVGLLIEGADTMQDLLRPIVDRYARELSEAPEVQRILKEVAAYRDRRSGVERLDSRRGSKRRADPADPGRGS